MSHQNFTNKGLDANIVPHHNFTNKRLDVATHDHTSTSLTTSLAAGTDLGFEVEGGKYNFLEGDKYNFTWTYFQKSKIYTYYLIF